jgi:hypothetical protein
MLWLTYLLDIIFAVVGISAVAGISAVGGILPLLTSLLFQVFTPLLPLRITSVVGVPAMQMSLLFLAFMQILAFV